MKPLQEKNAADSPAVKAAGIGVNGLMWRILKSGMAG